MENKKRFISFVVLAILALGVIVLALVLPLVNITSKSLNTGEIIPEASGTFGLISFTNGMLWFSEACFNAGGPVWLSILGISLNWLIIFVAVALLIFSIIEVCTIKKQLIIKQNCTAQKIALFVGWLGVGVFVFEIISFALTTALGKGYFVYTPNAQVFVGASLSVSVLVCAYVSGKSQKTGQVQKKVRDCLCYALTFVFVVLFCCLIFIPQVCDESLWGLSMMANELGNKPVAGWLFVGISQWVTFLMAIPVLFLIIRTLTGFVKTLKGRDANKTAGAVRRWCVAWTVISAVYLLLMMAAIIIIFGAFSVDGELLISPITFLMPVLLILPYMLSTFLPYNKINKNAIKEIQK